MGDHMDKHSSDDLTSSENLLKQCQDVKELKEQYLALKELYSESEERFWSFFYANDSVKLLINPSSGYIFDANQNACQFYGHPKNELTQKRIHDFIVIPEHIVDMEIEKSLYDWNRQFHFQHRIASKALRDVDVVSGPIKYKRNKYVLSIIQDTSRQKRLEESLWHFINKHNSQSKNIDNKSYGLILDNITTQVWYFRDQETYGHANQSHIEFLGRDKDEVEGKKIHDIMRVEEADLMLNQNMKAIHSKKEIHSERWIKNAKGENRLLSITHIPKLDVHDQVEYIVCTAEDCTERYQKMEELKKMLVKRESEAMLDTLTGIPNRRSFNAFLRQEWGRAKRESVCISLLMIDIDHFKSFNDYYGHSAGDDCLVKIAQVLTASVNRSTDHLSRYGGEEFAAVLPSTDVKGARQVAESLRHNVFDLKIPHEALNSHDVVTVSVGSATIIPLTGLAEVNETVLIKAADQALYEAKQNGRNTVVVQDLRFDGKKNTQKSKQCI